MMDATRFVTGQTFNEFLAAAQKYQDLWTLGARRASVPADVTERFAALSASVRLIVLSEDWCLDAVGVVPYLAKLANECSRVEFRSFSRDANPDLMDAHLTNGTRSIPVVIAYDENWTELGWWGPRPSELQQWATTAGTLVPKPERYQHIRQWYARDHGATSMREITAMVMAALDSRATQSPSAATAG